MTSKHSFLLATAVYLLSLVTAVQASEWDLATEEDGISVWTSSIDKQRINSFRAEAVLDHSLTKVLAALRDVDRYSEWMSDCHEGNIFSRTDENNYSSYMRWDLPFPFKDREFVQRVSIEESADRIEMNVSPIPDDLPINSKYVRVRSAQIQWVLTSLGNNKTKTVQTGYADPAGRLPTSITNRFAKTGPYQTMSELRRWLAKQSES